MVVQIYQELTSEEITEDWLWRNRLEGVLDYLSEEHRDKVREALVLAYTSHEGQYRKSGEKFITHPVEVTRILAGLKMDWESLAAGLLHDAVEDQPNVVSFEEIGVRASSYLVFQLLFYRRPVLSCAEGACSGAGE